MVYGIIAAGEGSRLKADGYPGFKPMVEIAGESLMERLIRIFLDNDHAAKEKQNQDENQPASALYIILNTAEKEVGAFIRQLPAAAAFPIHIIYQDTPSSFHSFYALLNCIPPAHRTQLCLSTIDPIFTESAFKDYINAFRQNKDLDGLMAVTSFVEDDKPLHVYTDPHMGIRQFAGTPQNGQPWVSGGIYLLREKALAVAEEAMQAGISKMRNYQQALLDAGLSLQAYDLGKIIDIDHVSDIALAEALIQTNNNKTI